MALRAPDGEGPHVSPQQRDVPRTTTRSWIHLDLYSRDQKREVERLVRLGAHRYPWRYEPGADYVVLEDPDGNLFCVVQDDGRSCGHSEARPLRRNWPEELEGDRLKR